MEQNQLLDDQYQQSGEGLHLNAEAATYLENASKWATFLGILLYIGAGFMLIVGLMYAFFMNSFLTELDPTVGAGMGAGFGVFFAAYAVLMFFLAQKMYNFGRDGKKAVEEGNNVMLTSSLRNLNLYLKILGILAIVILVLYGIGFLFGIAGTLLMG